MAIALSCLLSFCLRQDQARVKTDQIQTRPHALRSEQLARMKGTRKRRGGRRVTLVVDHARCPWGSCRRGHGCCLRVVLVASSIGAMAGMSPAGTKEEGGRRKDERDNCSGPRAKINHARRGGSGDDDGRSGPWAPFISETRSASVSSKCFEIIPRASVYQPMQANTIYTC